MIQATFALKRSKIVPNAYLWRWCGAHRTERNNHIHEKERQPTNHKGGNDDGHSPSCFPFLGQWDLGLFINELVQRAIATRSDGSGPCFGEEIFVFVCHDRFGLCLGEVLLSYLCALITSWLLRCTWRVGDNQFCIDWLDVMVAACRTEGLGMGENRSMVFNALLWAHLFTPSNSLWRMRKFKSQSSTVALVWCFPSQPKKALKNYDYMANLFIFPSTTASSFAKPNE